MRDDEILRRRARFVGAALLVAGCSKDESRVAITPTPSAEKATTSAPSASAPPRVIKVAAPPDRPPRKATVSAAAEKQKDAELARIDKVYSAVDGLAGSIPTVCATSDPKCVAAWKDYFGRLEDARDANYLMPSCPPKGADAIALDELQRAHAAWHGLWLQHIDEAVVATLEKAEASGHKTLLLLWGDARNAHARPCLSIACP